MILYQLFCFFLFLYSVLKNDPNKFKFIVYVYPLYSYILETFIIKKVKYPPDLYLYYIVPFSFGQIKQKVTLRNCKTKKVKKETQTVCQTKKISLKFVAREYEQ